MLNYPSPLAEYRLKKKVEALENLFLTMGRMYVQVIIKPIEGPKPVPVDDIIINYVCEFYNVKWDKVIGDKRFIDFVGARYMVCYLMREYLQYSFQTIGYKVGGRDHSIAAYACRKVADLYSVKDDKVTRCIEGFKKHLYNNEISKNHNSAKSARNADTPSADDHSNPTSGNTGGE